MGVGLVVGVLEVEVEVLEDEVGLLEAEVVLEAEVEGLEAEVEVLEAEVEVLEDEVVLEAEVEVLEAEVGVQVGVVEDVASGKRHSRTTRGVDSVLFSLLCFYSLLIFINMTVWFIEILIFG